MRTTVTLDADTERLVRARMEAEGVSFKKALNDSIRDGAAGRPEPEPFVQRTHSMGSRIDLTHANAIVGQLDDEAILAVMRRAEAEEE